MHGWRPLDLNRILITVKNAAERTTLVKDNKRGHSLAFLAKARQFS